MNTLEHSGIFILKIWTYELRMYSQATQGSENGKIRNHVSPKQDAYMLQC